MSNKTEKRRKQRKNRSQKRKSSKRRVRGGGIWPFTKPDPTSTTNSTPETTKQQEGIKDDQKPQEPIKETTEEKVSETQPAEKVAPSTGNTAPTEEKKGMFSWFTGMFNKKTPKTGGKRRNKTHKK